MARPGKRECRDDRLVSSRLTAIALLIAGMSIAGQATGATDRDGRTMNLGGITAARDRIGIAPRGKIR
jgi:hypothetical protein